MNREDVFYRQITDVPELPSDLFDGIDRTIRRRRSLRRSFFALAASVVLLAGTGVTVGLLPRSPALPPEVSAELQNVHDYLNGNDLEGDLELYAVVAGY